MFKEIKVEQGSPEWLAWRKTVITATDSSSIMGNNPWTSAYKCWQRKLGLIEEQASNEAMERGKRLEPLARDQFIERFGINMVPKVVESTEFIFLGASLDGINSSGNLLLEIKCGGEKLHEQAIRGEIPAYYLDQIQHQLLVTGAEKCFYYSYNGYEGTCIEVFPDAKFRETFIPKARAFWKCIALNEPPALILADYKDMNHDSQWKEISEEYQNTIEIIKNLEEIKEGHRKKLLELAGDNNCIGHGIKVMKIIARGRVAYDEIPELQGVDIDKYRKSSSTIWKICAT